MKRVTSEKNQFSVIYKILISKSETNTPYAIAFSITLSIG